MRQLNGVEASFLAGETSTAVGQITSVLVLDTSTSPEPWTFPRLQALLEARLADIPALTDKLVQVPLGLDRPYWTTDNAFDLSYHLRHIAVGEPGGRDELADLVARIHERPLDRRRPLWECYLVDGLEGGRRKAVITKLHHAAVDGLSGLQLLAGLVDLTPDAPLARPRPGDDGNETAETDETDDAGPDDEGDERDEPPSSAELLRRAVADLASSPRRLVRAGATASKLLPVLGPTLGRHGPAARGDETAGELLRRFGTAPSTPFNGAISPHRRWAYASVPLEVVRAIKSEAGTSVNDVVLAVVASMLRDWLLERDALPDRPLAAMVPMSIRSEAEADAVGNFVSPTITTLATHLADPVARLQAIKAGMDRAKATQQEVPADALTEFMQIAPPALGALAARLVTSTRLGDRVRLPFNLVVSNVPGPTFPVYLAGAQVVNHLPVSTIVDSLGLNVTIMSTTGVLDFGLTADRELLPDVWALADRLPIAVAELAAALGVENG